ncbi:MAG: leucyl/phenylalanyl-tRNA--protein transferase [Magnetococcus sp. DMHC-6]
MPVFRLPKECLFPPPALAEPNGLLAVGGDLSSKRLLAAYAEGIFPWYSHDEPLLWWSPDPRMVLFPEELHISKSLRKLLNQKKFLITFDQDFAGVIGYCANLRATEGTWITPQMQKAYLRLHKKGHAHSVEAWSEEESGRRLVGGAYGVALGGCFFGESMFHLEANASKVAFVTLVNRLHTVGFTLIDCQMHTAHLAQFGAREIPRQDFLKHLIHAQAIPPIPMRF